MKNLLLATISILSTCLLYTPANAASFDCNKAASWVEKTVCDSPEISKLDDTMAKKYKSNLATSSDYEDSKASKDRLIANQSTWLTFQRNTCKNEECLIREYKEYIEEQTNYGVAWNFSDELSPSDLPSKNAFGEFSQKSQISIYNSDTQQWEDSGEATNTVSVHSVANKPYLSIIEGVLIFTNAHTCDLGESKAIWSENHWVINDDQPDKNVELRLYPATYKSQTQLLLRDMDDQYRRLHCGMRGYFDGIILEREVS
ncbi:lysozyme inhibitor LprI family protein [Psychrobacter fjordensis]|uniref:lysozyme inhibitor LprI family protein n=1 Tax=Psychrobacter fjordensis TaxID=664424 RepID=UPI00191B19FD|nr:lysozyme inhibitor LprI family protein [Psychrobacter fjordensis]